MKGFPVLPLLSVVAIVFLGIGCGISKADHEKTVTELKKALSKNKKSAAEYEKIVAEHNKTVAEYDRTMTRLKEFATKKDTQASTTEITSRFGRNSTRGEGGRPDSSQTESAPPNSQLLREIETLRAEVAALKKKLAAGSKPGKP